MIDDDDDDDDYSQQAFHIHRMKMGLKLDFGLRSVVDEV
jgi:hypothetical protein